MPPPSYLTTFVHEVEDLLERIEAAILALETAPADPELIHQLFRAFHTLKGSAGVAGVLSIANFKHHVASLLAATRGEPGSDPAVGSGIVTQLDALTAQGVAPAPPPPGPMPAP